MSSTIGNKQRFTNYNKYMIEKLFEEFQINTKRFLSSITKNIKLKMDKDEDFTEEIKEKTLNILSDEFTYVGKDIDKDTKIIIDGQLKTYANKLLFMFFNVKRQIEQETESQLHDIINVQLPTSKKDSYISNSEDEDEEDEDPNLQEEIDFNRFIDRFNMSNLDSLDLENHVSINYNSNSNDEDDEENITSREEELIQKNVTEIRAIASSLSITLKKNGKTKNKAELISEIISKE